jgi:hypothetical protein
LGKGEVLEFNVKEISKIIEENTVASPLLTQFSFVADGVMMSDVNAIIAWYKDKLEKKKDWIRRFNNFSKKYLAGDLELTGQCLKQVSIFHKWNQLQASRVVYWEDYDWSPDIKEAGAEIAAACHGGACEINL